VSDSAIFVFGLLMFFLFAGGLSITYLELSKAGAKDQTDADPPSRALWNGK